MVLILAIILAGVVFLYPRESEPSMVVDAGTVALFHDANAVVVRYIYPYPDPPSAVAAGTAAIMVFVGLGKTPIVQSIDTQTGICYTNEGEINRMVERNAEDCFGVPYPVIVLLEDKQTSIVMHDNVVEVRGPPERLRALTLYALSEMFPDVNRLYVYAVQKAAELNIPTPRHR